MLYNRIINGGTINEPTGKPTPHFALLCTVNWMHALRILAEDNEVNFGAAKTFYRQQGKRHMDVLVENTVLEQLFLGLHHLSALEQMSNQSPSADYARVGIIAWYYGIANAASAMIAAQNGSFQEDHAGTAKMWDTDIAARGLAMEPFSWRISSLVEKTYRPEVNNYKATSIGKLTVKPNTVLDAQGAAAEYLSGTAKRYAWQAEERIIPKSNEYKALGVSNYRTKKAQEVRDKALSTRTVGFVHQASRYRGKANYREALFLAYGKNTETMLQEFVADQAYVLKAFLAIAGAFACRKLGKKLWDEFVADVDANKAFTLSAASVWT